MRCLVCRAQAGWYDGRIGQPLKFYSMPMSNAPDQAFRRDMWIARIKTVHYEPFTPSPNTRLCSLHFVNVDPQAKDSVPDQMEVDAPAIHRKADGSVPKRCKRSF